MWEREVRILREALAPFYQLEKEMRRKVIDIEDRLEGNYDEHVRLRERVVTVDDVTMSLEKKVEELEGLRSKRRRVGRNNQVREEPSQNGYVSPDTNAMRRVSSSVDERSVHTPSSRALSPNGVAPAAPEPEEPRSSGILNLAEIPRPTNFNMSQRLSPALEEPRSSGFLTLDLAERLSQKAASDHGQPTLQQAARITPPQDRPSPPGYAKSNPDVSRASRTPPETQVVSSKAPQIDVMVLPVNTSPRKRKHHVDHIALDVLADVTVASPLIH
ncbi:uncharacterized protein Z518_01023 [Rhinocladiella mackenziei CBS 650.93]|uniref:Uncharacterized protein n=1 Tax=Rhinocladiella mackenziei CBS 650.93 TaxID=1442369 RepID=A0A0D2G592_9EURO|nr:uncharacterized protein Z518_01023 [Rhinocladiella mackenziei CBS 650.93]KIX09942.1 hypothetical protein Z518_01023 [Rhinocladiella mackenziei CBS 650.93]